uniref:Uncharacterized protein n=1 Tax=Lactuca sativa TaxID=4236 RepID=A0A9R1UXC5_LACSA|nr:hypothetical protein LSAT_V11C700360660 [Lactuca sativa]
MASRLAPVTGGEKLISSVLEAKRPTISCMTNLGWRQILFSSNNIKAYFGARLSRVLAWCVRVGRNQPNAPGVLAPSIFTSYVSRVLFNALAVFALKEINLSKVTFSTTAFYLSRVAQNPSASTVLISPEV